MDILSGRTQRTRVGAAYSEAIAMASAIIQGSCVGTILFVIYVNDVVDCFDLDVVCSLHADDIKLYTCIRSVSDCSRLQLAIDFLVSRAIKWQLLITMNKCMVSHVFNDNIEHYTYSIMSLSLPNVVTGVKDLGVMFDAKLKFNIHANKILIKDLARTNLIITCFLSRDPKNAFLHLQGMQDLF